MNRLAWCALVTLLPSSAMLAPAPAADFPQPYDSEPNKTVPRMSPAEAAASIKVPDGFRTTVFAAEPDVQNPIAMAWDGRGRIWVAENYTYAESAKRFDLALRDRVIILEDADGDGRAESRKVFTDDVQMLTSVEVGRGGVWLMAPPQLLFIPDRDGDDKPDGPPQVVLDGFTVAKSNYHNFANGLRWGPDGWLYGRCGHSCPGRLGVPGTPDDRRVPIIGGVWRFHPARKVVEVLCHGTTNPWGHDWDQHGELFFVNSVNGHLWHMMTGAQFKESAGESKNPAVYERLDTIADHWHYDAKEGWQNSRNLRENQMGGGHAHAGTMIYQGDNWPAQYRGRLFTLNLHGRRANVERLERKGAGYVAHHDADAFQSGDPWFRGIDLTTGPDGAVYVLDWSDVGECHEHNGVHRTSGRIFKISYGTAPLPAAAAQITYPRCTNGDGKLQQLWRQHQAGITTPAQLRSLLNDPDEHVRVWAIRLLTDSWPLDTYFGPVKGATYPDDPETRTALLRLAADDPSGLVHLALASVIHRLPVDQRPALATALVRHEKHASDQNLPSLVWNGLIPVGDADPTALVPIAKECRWPSTLRWITRNLAGRINEKPEAVDALLATFANGVDRDRAAQDAVLTGLSEAFRGWRKAPKPKAWDALAKTDAATRAPDLVRELGTLFGDGRALDDVRRIVLDRKADDRTRLSALKALIEARPADLRQTCESLLVDRPLAAAAARGLALFDDPAVAARLVQSYRGLTANDRTAVLDVLVSRPTFARVLLDNVGTGKGKIPAADLTPLHARQVRGLDDATLTAKLNEVWGAMQETDPDKKKAIAEWRAKLTPEALAKADLAKGRQAFAQVCAACHTLYGEGGKVGPDLTGAGRSDLGYVLEHVVDPSAIVPADYRMTILAMKDGRVLNGIVTRQDAKTLTLREQTQETTIATGEVERQRVSPQSMMPEGLFQSLPEEQVRDLVAYLMHPTQVPLPKEPATGR